MLYNYESLLSLPDITQWDTNKVINISGIFHNCESLLPPPNIQVM